MYYNDDGLVSSCSSTYCWPDKILIVEGDFNEDRLPYVHDKYIKSMSEKENSPSCTV